MVFPARLGRESEIKREGRRQNRRSESGGWKRLLLSSLFTRRIGVFYSFFGSPVLCCRRRFLLPRRQVGVGLRWMQRFSGLTTLPERGVDSFSLWRRSLMNSSFFLVLRPCFRRRFRPLGADRRRFFLDATVLGFDDASRKRRRLLFRLAASKLR